jgi:hypothetical protein
MQKNISPISASTSNPAVISWKLRRVTRMISAVAFSTGCFMAVRDMAALNTF